MKRTINPTPTAVVFRTFKDGSTIALFPYVIHSGYLVSSFMHVGQHGGAGLDIIATTRPATADEAAVLTTELTAAPYYYSLQPLKRINYAHFRAAVTATARY